MSQPNISSGSRVWKFRVMLIGLMICGGVAAAVLAAELIFRVFGLNRPVYTTHPDNGCVRVIEGHPIGWVWVPGACGTDGHGMFEWNEPRAKSPPEGVFRYLVIGDSVAAGTGVMRQETFENVVERNFRSQGLKVESFNLGSPGSNAQQWLHYWKYHGFEAHAAIIAVCPNDADASLVLTIADKEIYWPWVENGFTVWRRIPLGQFWWKFQLFQTFATHNAWPRDEYANDHAISARSFAAAVQTPLYLKKRGLKVMMVLLPYFGEASRIEGNQLPRCREYHRLLKGEWEKNGIPWVEPAPGCLAGDPDFVLDPADVYHPSAAGHVWLAGKIAEGLARHGMTPVFPPPPAVKAE
ncbi:MAG: hypothetical protein GMKNLPBB_01860 [Myxococcota bacterium]|nr:hypothetical protein [Myxococcota bacterium]